MQFIKESIFVSAIRSFFNALLAMIGVLIGVSLLAGVAIAASGKSPISAPGESITMEILPDAHGDADPLLGQVPVILQIDFKGIIGLENCTATMIQNYLRMAMHSATIKKEQIKGVLLNVESPGGVAPESVEIYNAIMRFKEEMKVPVYVFAKSVLASAAYLISCSADKIYTTDSCVVGSIGVKTTPFFNYYGLMEKVGIQSLEITQGKDKVMYPTFSPLSEGDKGGNGKPKSYQSLEDITKALYDQFLTIVVKARETHGLTRAKLVNEYGARVYFANKAEILGYIDHSSAYRELVLADLAKDCGIDDETKYQVVQFKHKRSAIQSLILNSCEMWTLKTKEWLYGIKHEGLFDGQPLFICDYRE